jgi:hypothetical protein
MLSFSIPYDDLKSGGKRFFNFSVEQGSLLFAGSRKLTIDKKRCSLLIDALGSLGFTFLTGCAKGVDDSFRQALGLSDYAHLSLMACAFPERAKSSHGIMPLIVVPPGLPPRAALAKRTLWMTAICKMLVLFPASPIGRGSRLAFKSAIMSNKPVFVVTNERPKESDLYSIFSSSLFGIVDGFWCIPPVYHDTGLCYHVY